MKYFAYGSNLFTPWLRSRVSSAAALGVASLGGHRLAWHKRSVDGSGKCDAYQTGAPEDVVTGVVFAIDAAERPALDRVEGPGYAALEVRVALGVELVQAFTYVARPEAIDASLHPYHWYKTLVVSGAAEHVLPSGYIAGLQARPSVPDVDAGRDGKAWGLIEAHRG